MSKGAQNVFAIIVNLMSTTWEPKHIMIGLFEAIVTRGVATVVKLKQILDKFGITQKILAYIKNKGSNL
jgi:predicted tellurium resistance membrane protein TerC